MNRVIASAGLLMLGAAGAATVAAGADSPDKPWSVTASLRGFYDDNINTAPNNTPGKVSSLGFEVRPGASLDLDWGASKFTASYLYDLRYYDQRHNTDQSHDLELNFDHNISERYALNLSDSLVIAQEPDVIAGTAALATPVRVNGNNLRNMGSINFRAQMTRLLGFVVGYANTVYDYDETFGNSLDKTNPSRSALLDRDEHQLTLDSTWQIQPETTGVLGYTFGAVYYASPESILSQNPAYALNLYSGPSYLPASSRDNYSHSLYVGADHSFSPDLTGSIRVGMTYLDYYNDRNIAAAGFPKQTHSTVSPFVDLSASYAYAKDGTFKLGFRHSHNATDLTASAANPTAGVTLDEESSVVYGSVVQKLTPISPRLTGTLTGQYQNSVFNQGPVDGESESIYLLGLDLNYQFDRYFSVETGYNYDLVCSDINGRGYSRNQIFIGVDVSY